MRQPLQFHEQGRKEILVGGHVHQQCVEPAHDVGLLEQGDAAQQHRGIAGRLDRLGPLGQSGEAGGRGQVRPGYRSRSSRVAPRSGASAISK